MILAKLSKLFGRKKPLYTLDQAVDLADKSCEDFENLLFYLSQIPDVEYTEADRKYFERAMFNLCSSRDELRIKKNAIKETKRWTNMLSRLDNSKQSNSPTDLSTNLPG